MHTMVAFYRILSSSRTLTRLHDRFLLCEMHRMMKYTKAHESHSDVLTEPHNALCMCTHTHEPHDALMRDDVTFRYQRRKFYYSAVLSIATEYKLSH